MEKLSSDIAETDTETTGNPGRILIIDDTPAMLQLLARTLKKKYNLFIAKDGEEGLRIARSAPRPDLILLDIVMPGMDGFAVCKRLKDDPATEGIPVIFLTALNSADDENKGFALGAVDFITKPFNPVIVEARVDTQVQLKRHRDHMETIVQERAAELVKFNRKLQQEIKERERSETVNQALFSIASAVNTTDNVAELYRAIHRTLNRVIDTCNFAIALYDAATNEVQYPYIVDESEPNSATENPSPVLPELALEVLKSGRSMIFSKADITKIFDNLKEPEPRRRIPETWIGIPLKIKENLIGAITVYNYYDPGYFDKVDLNFLHTISSQIALAIDHKRALTAMKKSEARYKSLSQVTTEGILFHENGRVIDCNDAFAAILDMDRKDLIGRDAVDMFVLPEYHDLIRDIIKNNVQEAYEVQARKPDGTIFPAEMQGKEAWYRDKTMRVVAVRDITERRRNEEKIIRLQKMEAIGTLAGGIAHDFNNLLGGILGNIGLLELYLSDSHPALPKVKTIEKIVQRGANLAKQLLGYAREGKYRVVTINVNALIQDTIEIFGRSRKQIEIQTHLQKDVWTVEGDRTQIEQVLLNLYINADQAMPDGGTLLIKSENITLSEIMARRHMGEPGNYIMISVQDTGHGMDKQTKKRIFDPFFTTKDVGKGTGLGLASAYGIIKSHNGNIDVYSEPGKGTIFKVYLPASAKAVMEKPKIEEKLLHGTETVLLVDDEYEFRDVGEQMLREMGYTVLTATNGLEACQILEQEKNHIALVILDMIMPVMNGREAFLKMKQMQPALRILLSSGYSADSEANEILNHGCDGFLQKPFRMIELSKTIRAILDKPREP